MACREGEIRLVGREGKWRRFLPVESGLGQLVRAPEQLSTIVAWAGAACCKAAETRVACHRTLNFFRGAVAGSSLSGAGPIWGAAIKCPVGKDVWFWALAQAGVQFLWNAHST